LESGKGFVSGLECGLHFGQVEEGNVSKVGVFSAGLIDHYRDSDDLRSIGFAELLHGSHFVSGAEDVIYQEDFFVVLLFEELAEAQWLVFVQLLGPVDAAGSEGFAESEGHGHTSGGGGYDGEFGDGSSDFRVSANQPAQGYAQHFHVAVVSEG
jgi:hypothetical protein